MWEYGITIFGDHYQYVIKRMCGLKGYSLIRIINMIMDLIEGGTSLFAHVNFEWAKTNCICVEQSPYPLTF